MDIRYAILSDQSWLTKHDSRVTPGWIERCLQRQEIIIALVGTKPVGFLRFSYFWGKIPYMDMIWVMPEHRRQGCGAALYGFWEQKMRQKGYTLLMTSSMQNEPESHAWHVRNGFKPSGQLTFGRLQTIPELFFVKEMVATL